MNHKQSSMSGKVLENRLLIAEHFLITIAVSGLLQPPEPGQFVMLRLKGRIDPLLGRPFSVYSYDRQGDHCQIQILYRVVGKGTRLMSELKSGAVLEITGPHGHTFDIDPRIENVVLIAGGIGVAPIAYLASYYRKTMQNTQLNIVGYMGTKTADQLLGVEGFQEDCSCLNISTDDGTAGSQEMVTERFAKEASSYRADRSIVYACGPSAMLQRLSEIIKEYPIPCQVLLEQRMACGIGACLGCVVKVKSKEEMHPYVRVCTEGPVFNIRDIVWS